MINPSAIASKSVAYQDTPAAIEMLTAQPVTTANFSPARPPGQICGFYNGTIDGVELYVVMASGTRFARVI